MQGFTVPNSPRAFQQKYAVCLGWAHARSSLGHRSRTYAGKRRRGEPSCLGAFCRARRSRFWAFALLSPVSCCHTGMG
jgi:hypothetical protein